MDGARALRVLNADGARDYRLAREAGLFTALARDGMLLAAEPTDLAPADCGGRPGGLVLEQRRLAIVSYPYEWTFDGLRAAALLHLDLQMRAAEFGFTLKDATPFNVQFEGPKPIFIDIGSFVPSRPGEYWRGYRQFCEQFLNPLLLCSEAGIPFNAVYRGYLRGIPTTHLAQMLPWRSRFHPSIFLHVMLHARFEHKSGAVAAPQRARPMSQAAQMEILRRMRKWIAGLVPGQSGRLWSNYTATRIYSADEAAQKRDFVRSRLGGWGSQVVLDVGANTGEMAALALDAGARLVIGLEQDAAAANLSYLEAAAAGRAFVPLVMDVTNPSPGQGWGGVEWQDFVSRNSADTVLGLALLHHLVLGAGIPLQAALDWVCALAPRGIVEYVPCDDPMSLSLRARIDNPAAVYSEADFRRCLERNVRITGSCDVTSTGRILFAFEKG